MRCALRLHPHARDPPGIPLPYAWKPFEAAVPLPLLPEGTGTLYPFSLSLSLKLTLPPSSVSLIRVRTSFWLPKPA